MTTTYKCVPETVTQKVAVCKFIPASCGDQCVSTCNDCGRKRGCFRRCGGGDCAPAGQYVTEYKDVQCTVMRAVPETREVLVNVCRYETQQRQGTRCVVEAIPETREVLVNTCRYEAQQRQGKRCVVEAIPETREVLVNVTTCKPVERVGTRCRTVCETVKETVNVTQTYCEKIPYKTTVKVPVPAAPACK